MHELGPREVHSLEALAAAVAVDTDEEPEGVARHERHGQRSGGEAAFVEPLRTSCTADHATVPFPFTTTVAVATL